MEGIDFERAKRRLPRELFLAMQSVPEEEAAQVSSFFHDHAGPGPVGSSCATRARPVARVAVSARAGSEADAQRPGVRHHAISV